MAFKYVPYTFRDGEIIEPTRVLENMRVLASELNGKLDRENLPEDAITDSMIEANALTELEGQSSFTQPSESSELLDWDKVVIASKTMTIVEDSVLIASFQGAFEWIASSFAANIRYESTRSSNARFVLVQGGPTIFTAQVYFQLRINGDVVSQSRNHGFLRRLDSVYMSGTRPILAGQVVVDVTMRVITTDDNPVYGQSHIGMKVKMNSRRINTKLKKR